MLATALEQYRLQQRITAAAVREARRVAARGNRAVVPVIVSYQLASIALTTSTTEPILAEQAITAPPAAGMSATALLTGATALQLLEAVGTPDAFDRLIMSLILDAARTAAAVDIARRPTLTGYIRSLNPPSCSRCAVLAGRIYPYSTGFERHPQCDCLMTPTTEAAGKNLITDPTDLIRKGQIRGLSKGDMAALDAGADLGRVVNIRSRAAGLTVGSSVYSRAGKLTPQGILALASTRTEAIALLRKYGYLLP